MAEYDWSSLYRSRAVDYKMQGRCERICDEIRAFIINTQQCIRCCGSLQWEKSILHTSSSKSWDVVLCDNGHRNQIPIESAEMMRSMFRMFDDLYERDISLDAVWWKKENSHRNDIVARRHHDEVD